MADHPKTSIDDVAALPLDQRMAPLLELGRHLDAADPARERFVALAVDIVESGEGSARERLELGEILGRLGDPRLRTPDQSDYWITVPGEQGDIVIGRHLVTNYEYTRWVDAGGYDQREHWSDEGWEWLQSCPDPWPVRASAPGSEPFLIPNQPVVGVTWYEAEAYARSVGARLLRADERVWVVRGRERRPYPWGSPFGEGHANTREEVLGRPCAVGLYRDDRTPEGVTDLAGNVAEWTADGVGGERLVHPGAYDQPSLASWAKALAMVSPDSRWSGLGFRLAKDAT